MPPISPTPPPLVAGDRLSRDEFERRYEAMPDVKKAELIEGVVYMPSPARYTQHASPHGLVVAWLGHYTSRTPGVDFADNCSTRLDFDNEPQPDALLRVREECGGQSKVTATGWLEGAPELVVEVTASTASYDLHDKLNAYRRNGVREYVVWRILDEQLDWLGLEGGRYLPREPDERDLYRSREFPGLWLDFRALAARDLAAVFATLDAGMSTEEHAQFVRRLGAT